MDTETSEPKAAEGDPAPAAVDALFAASYDDLRRLARARLQGGGRNTVLNTTALVSEAFLKLAGRSDLAFADRQQFLGYASRVMHSVIIDLVRQRQTERHGGDAPQVTLSTAIENTAVSGEEQILRVHEALEELRKVDPRMAQVVEMRYFAGFSDEEIAQALGVADRTVRRDWQQARLILAEALAS